MKLHMPPRRILVPMDFSGPSDAAIDTAKALAARWESTLEILSIVPDAQNDIWNGPGGPALVVRLPREEVLKLKRQREARLRRAAEDFPPSRLRVRALSGEPALLLARQAESGTADLIVMGTHGYSGIDRLLLGSVAETVIRRSRVPVLSVHEHRPLTRIASILAPVNMTFYADQALLYASDTALSLGARLSVLYVVAPSSDETLPAARRWLRMHVERLLGEKRSGQLTLQTRRGPPNEVILAEALRERHDLIALSAHCRSFFEEFMSGSKVEQVLRHCATPVLATPVSELSKAKGRGAEHRGVPLPDWVSNKVF